MSATFTCFPRLPLELRRKIWEFCIPEGRVMEFDCLDPADIGNTCETWSTSYDNAKQPCLSRICRESREIAFEKGGFLWTMKQFESLQEYGAFNKLHNPWFYPGTDIVHLNWDPCYEPNWCSNKSPVPYFLMLARAAQGASIMAPLLQCFEKIYGYVSGHPIGLDHESLAYLGGMNEYKVSLLAVSIHATEAQVIESGLFENLAAPIQLIDTSDEATIHRMYKLWRSTFQDDEYNHDDISGKRHAELKYVSEGMVFSKEDFDVRVCRWQEEVERTWLWHKWVENIRENTMDTIDSPEKVWIKPNIVGGGNSEPWDSPDFRPQGMPDYDSGEPPVAGIDLRSIGMPEYDFNKRHPWAQAVLDSMPRFRPVIMFRHCPDSCYLK